MQIKNKNLLKWLYKLLLDHKAINHGKYCSFHNDYGNITNGCFNLRDEIEDLICRGYLCQFVV